MKIKVYPDPNKKLHTDSDPVTKFMSNGIQINNYECTGYCFFGISRNPNAG
jgi:hypothetical protein